MVGHVEKWCYSTEGGTVYMGDLPPSMTEEQVKEMVEEFGKFEHMRIGSNYDGGKWAMLNMVDKEQGQSVIDGLHMFELKGREIIVKWKEEGLISDYVKRNMILIIIYSRYKYVMSSFHH